MHISGYIAGLMCMILRLYLTNVKSKRKNESLIGERRREKDESNK